MFVTVRFVKTNAVTLPGVLVRHYHADHHHRNDSEQTFHQVSLLRARRSARPWALTVATSVGCWAPERRAI